MKKNPKVIISIIMIVILAFAAGFAGCSSGKGTTIKVYNWGDYIDESVLAEFEQKTGVKVIYDTFATNEDMYVKIKNGGSDYDVAIPSDYMIRRMIREGMLKKINLENVPNYKYIGEDYKSLAYDVNNEYSVPYMWGTVGIIYNKTMVSDAVKSWKILWDKKYEKQILMLDSQRDSIGITLKMLGYSLNTKNPEELDKAKEALMEQKKLVLAYIGDEVKDKMISGEAAMAVVWSGDAMFMKGENPDLEYVIPEEGSNYWFDAMVIPSASKHQKEAEMFIDFMCDPEIAFKNTDYIGYATPNTETMKMLDAELLEDKSAYPKEEDLTKCEVFEDLSDSLRVYDEIWTEIKAK